MRESYTVNLDLQKLIVFCVARDTECASAHSYLCLLSRTKQNLLTVTIQYTPISLKLDRSAMCKTYYAYPLWLTNVDVVAKDSALDSILVESSKNELENPPSECRFGFGYLKNLPKTAAFPDECLVCSKLLKCFAKRE